MYNLLSIYSHNCKLQAIKCALYKENLSVPASVLLGLCSSRSEKDITTVMFLL